MKSQGLPNPETWNYLNNEGFTLQLGSSDWGKKHIIKNTNKTHKLQLGQMSTVLN